MTKLQAARLARGWTQTELAGKVGFAQGVVSLMERGWLVPRPDQAKRLAKALGLKAEELTEEVEA